MYKKLKPPFCGGFLFMY